uniref:Uncharacterized protein n=1 Tax=Triticum urartu TaxID=4572 RepID=A0A8R7TS78_TRIUA
MYASHTRRLLRRDRGARAHGGAARRRASTPLLCFVGAILLVAASRHTLLPKVPFLGSFWRVSLASGAYIPMPKFYGVKYELHTLPLLRWMRRRWPTVTQSQCMLTRLTLVSPATCPVKFSKPPQSEPRRGRPRTMRRLICYIRS